MNQLRDLRDFLRKNTPEKIFFLSENQVLYDPAEPCSLDLVFDRMYVPENPNMIYLSGGGCSMRLNNVVSVSMGKQPLPIWHVVNVRCRDYRTDEGGRDIVLVLQM